MFVASCKIGSSLWLALIHDLSKFYPSEWFPYARTFYKTDGSKQYNETAEFAKAWNYHQKRNKHHYQYWLITWDRGKTEPLEMPIKYVKEMVADWMGAGRAINGKWEVGEWYNKNKKNILLHPDTKFMVKLIIGRYEYNKAQ
jgi:hypothetical protein